MSKGEVDDEKIEAVRRAFLKVFLDEPLFETVTNAELTLGLTKFLLMKYHADKVLRL